ncbi:hypothetical protein BGX27_009284 [Mortierella sp. AM989]|nr:hypothetical protein BGX27_009284 [Mortierella sp. AM989]
MFPLLPAHIEKNPNLSTEGIEVAFKDFLQDAKDFHQRIDNELDRVEFYKGLAAARDGKSYSALYVMRPKSTSGAVQVNADPPDLLQQLTANNLDGVLKATDLDGKVESSIVLDFDYYQVISRQKYSLDPGKEKFMARGYSGYPRFDFMIGPMFIQVSVGEFGVHNNDD